MIVKVDPDTCTGCELCTRLCPGVFCMEGETARACADSVPPAQKDRVRDAATQCPAEAIRVDEAS